jgi:nitronate monooxygenase
MASQNKICQMFNIDHPILLAPMALTSGGKLSSAVTGAGGLGLIGGGYGDADWLEQEFTQAGNRPYGVGFITWRLAQNPQLLDQSLARKPLAVMLSFGDPAPFIPKIQNAGAKVICQIQNLAHARAAIEAGADILVAQGSEAGGHGATRGLAGLLPAVADIAGDVPVLAAGGLTENRDLIAAANLGASGALIGTRFFASDEALGHPNVKQRLVTSGGDQTVRTRVFDVARDLDWPTEYTVRAIRNQFTDKWHGNEDSLDTEKEAIIASYPGQLKNGEIDKIGVFAGEGLDRITAIEPAADIFKSLISKPIPWA